MLHGDGIQDFCHHRAWTPAPCPSSQTFGHLPPPVSWSRRRFASWPVPGPGPRGDGDARRAWPQEPEPTELRCGCARESCQKQSGTRPQDQPRSIRDKNPRTRPKTPPLVLPASAAAEAKSLKSRAEARTRPQTPPSQTEPAPSSDRLPHGRNPEGCSRNPAPAPPPLQFLAAAPPPTPP